jgi:hypothetical protein
MRTYHVIWLLFAVGVVGAGLSVHFGSDEDGGEGGLRCAHVGLCVVVVLVIGTILERLTTRRHSSRGFDVIPTDRPDEPDDKRPHS